MRFITKNIIILTLFIFITLLVAGQENADSKTKKADTLLNKYIEQVKFSNGFSSEVFANFQKLFTPEARIVFDVPFKNIVEQNEEIRQISKDDREQTETVNIYGKQVSVDLYIKILNIEAEKSKIDKLDYKLGMTGKKDLSRLSRDTLIYEISKQFITSEWSTPTVENYLVYILLVKDEPKISLIRLNDENIEESDIIITLNNASSKGKNDKDYLLSSVIAELKVNFRETINNKTIADTTDSIGQIIFERQANEAATVFLDTAYSLHGIRYKIPSDWKNQGKNVSDQPIGGFTIDLTPYNWNGLAYSILLNAGSFIPSNISLENFQAGSNFENKLGSKFGLAFNLTYFINHDKWKIEPKAWLFGVGSGFSIDYQLSKITSNGFEQQPYKFTDEGLDTCEIVFKGSELSESTSLVTLSLPIFLETKKRVGSKTAFSFRFGANFSLLLPSTYKASGRFSRWGYYEQYNPKPIKEDETQNYFNEIEKSYSGEVEYNGILAEAFFKMNWFFNVFNKNPDNSLELGLMFSMPFMQSTNFTYPDNPRQEYNGYWLNIENDEYVSLAYGAEKIYQYYFGISIGINLIKHRPK